MHHQFSAGMQVCGFHFSPRFVRLFIAVSSNSFVLVLQTVAVIPVLPHGVVQLGSFLPVSLFSFVDLVNVTAIFLN